MTTDTDLKEEGCYGPGSDRNGRRIWNWRSVRDDTGARRRQGGGDRYGRSRRPGGGGQDTRAGGEAIYLHQDVTLEETWPGIIEATERRFGRLDVMVANAGIGILCKAVEMSLADWRRQTAVNLDGVFLSVKYAVPAMRRTGGGSIIITSSVAGLRGSAGLAGYCATKGGVRLFAKAMAMECAAADDGIRVNTVHPGVIDTSIWTKIPAGTGSNEPIDPNEIARAGVPLRRAG
jgi:NAD(P)-dependent dehydrogenase (short-subunit alcohol dehydrogenase family)